MLFLRLKDRVEQGVALYAAKTDFESKVYI